MTDENKLLQATEAFKKSVDETKELAEKIKGYYEKGDPVNRDLKEKVDEALIKMNGHEATIAELKTHISTIENRDLGSDGAYKKTAGQLVVGSEQYKSRNNWTTGDKEVIQVKSIMNSGDDSAGVLIRPEYVGHIELPQQQLMIYDLLSHGDMSKEAIYFTQELGFANNADVVPEGEEKPESDITFKDCIEDAVVIAHHINTSKQAISDNAYLSSLIDNRLRYGLQLKREKQILSGRGRDHGEMNGILTQATEFKSPTDKIENVTYLDTLRLAMLQALLAEYPVDAQVLNPIDAAIIELMKDDVGRYIIGNPGGNGITSLWGKPVVQTVSMAMGSFLSGAFKMGAEYFNRWDATVAVSYEHKDNFTRNKATVLGEERGALAVYRPEAFVKGKFGAVVSGTKTTK